MSEQLMLAANPKSFLASKSNVTIGEPYVANPSGWFASPAADQVQFVGTKLYVATIAGAVRMFHANANGTTGAAANNAAKRKAATAARNRLGGSGWGFYLYTTDGVVHRLVSSVARTNATA